MLNSFPGSMPGSAVRGCFFLINSVVHIVDLGMVSVPTNLCWVWNGWIHNEAKPNLAKVTLATVVIEV